MRQQPPLTAGAQEIKDGVDGDSFVFNGLAHVNPAGHAGTHLERDQKQLGISVARCCPMTAQM
jgi:hypothetical protein